MTQPRWEGITRPYSAEDVVKYAVQSILNARWRNWARRKCGSAARRVEKRLHQQPRCTDWRQALQQAKAGIEAVYLSGWQERRTLTWRPACIRISRSIRQLGASGGGADQQYLPPCGSDPWSAGIEPGDPRYVDYFLPIVLMRKPVLAVS